MANSDDEEDEIYAILNDSFDEEDFLGFETNEVHRDDSNSSSEEEEVEFGVPKVWSWRSDPDIVSEVQDLPAFEGEPGLKVNIPDEKSPLNYFDLFFTDTLIDIIVVETNRYAEQSTSNVELSANSRMNSWKPTTADEMRLFFGIIFAMGLVDKLDIQQYWSADEVLNTPFFGKTISRDRFLLILKFIHFTDNRNHIPRGRDGYDPLFKIRPVYDSITEKFSSIYKPERHLSLDESTIGWRGNLHFRCYNQSKSHKFHMKVFVVAEGTSGYITKWEMYTGKRADTSDKGATYDVVMCLLDEYYGLGYIVYLDNYYSSPILYTDLFALDTGACGTVRPNRKGLPKEELKKKLKRGEQMALRDNELMVLKWKDKKDVHMLSTCHDASTAETGRRDRATGEPIRKPKAILDYNKYMGGVDRSDQLLQYHAFERKTAKFYKKVFFHLLYLCQVQAYLLYCKGTDKPMLHREFTLAVAKGLVKKALSSGNVTTPGRSGRAAANAQEISRLTGRHFPSSIPPQPGSKKSKPTRQCKVCQDAGTRKETRFQCEECNTSLCIQPCFQRFHTVLHY